ncbi:MAG: prepilin-type N-terminal cleavage/methylation domain-containing protein [Pseudohongiellaceae bacterium]|jgi:prepilin-type N-terminal cleavage/methylation domain-containing protein
MTLATSRQTGTERRLAACPPGSGSQGFTLLELIIVMMILSGLFGVGIGAFRSLANPERVAREQISETLHSARIFARSAGAASTVWVSPEEQTVSAWGLRPLGNWHFETDDGFGWPKALLLGGATIVPQGAIGSGLQIAGPAVVGLQDPSPSFDSPFGFGLDVMVAPSPGFRPMTLWERPGVWAVRIDQDDALEVALQVADKAGKGNEVRLAVPGVHFPADRMTRLQVVFDGRQLQVAVDGVQRGREQVFERAKALVSNPGVSQGTGRPPTHFRGLFDELHLWAVVQAGGKEFPDEIELEGPPQWIHWDAQGRLDPLWHNGPVEITFLSGEPRRRTVTELGLLGTVRRYSEAPLSAPTGASVPAVVGESAPQEDGPSDAADPTAGPTAGNPER